MDKVRELLSKKWFTAIIVAALLIFTFVSPLFSEKESNTEEQQTEQAAETEEETNENQGFKLKIGKTDIILLVFCLGSFGGIKLKQMYDEKLKQK